MNFEIIHKPDFPTVKVTLNNEESIRAESGAMVAMSSNVLMETKAQGGFLASAKRALLSGESFFQNTYRATGGAGEVYFSPATQGDLEHRQLRGKEIILSTGAYVAGSTDLIIDSKFGGFKSFFGGEGLFFLKVSGVGDLFFSSFGAIHQVEVDGEYIVDTGHIVGFESSLTYNIQKVGGLKSLFLSGEGLVCRFTGKGKVYIQSRNHNSFAYYANSFRRVVSRSNN
ncbi:MAG: TIGR00266 family protein [Leptospira sp.]|nr:TIGR00266 family protein [Leptospira sp.]